MSNDPSSWLRKSTQLLKRSKTLASKLSTPLTVDVGKKHEAIAEQFLIRQGLTLKERNYHSRRGEIDLIMTDGEILVFVEVRYRKHSAYGSASESVDRRKQQKLIKAAQHYLLKQYRHNEPPCRFDVIAIAGNNSKKPLEWLPNAFTL
ncbi:MAG: YraN family protein [Cellvibrionaceae bacterium]|nr:YraN family protein [Cellvibrionaceae bacterium]|tara:strand:- start:1143 stop:1586 length:444 start_codon:yes stop_codon:yes gene_type:complete